MNVALPVFNELVVVIPETTKSSKSVRPSTSKSPFKSVSPSTVRPSETTLPVTSIPELVVFIFSFP